MACNAILPLVFHENLFDFFKDRVDGAARRQRVAVSQDTVFYLSQLLAEQGHLPEQEPTPTLVELRERAANGSFAEAVTCWRRLGDRAMIALGFFREHLVHRRISTTYYAEMGAGAYGTLARLLRDPGVGLGEVFSQMSERFDTCTELIADVRDEAREENTADIVRLYAEWQTTGSTRAAERLRQLGVVPVRFGSIT